MVYLKAKFPEIGIDASNLSEMDAMLKNYFELMDKVVMLSKSDTTGAALKILKEDHGTAVWQTYMNMSGVEKGVTGCLCESVEYEFDFPGCAFISGRSNLDLYHK
jgi:hypothetical protein